MAIHLLFHSCFQQIHIDAYTRHGYVEMRTCLLEGHANDKHKLIYTGNAKVRSFTGVAKQDLSELVIIIAQKSKRESPAAIWGKGIQENRHFCL